MQGSQEVNPFQAGDLKAASNKQYNIMKTNVKHKKKCQQKKAALERPVNKSPKG